MFENATQVLQNKRRSYNYDTIALLIQCNCEEFECFSIFGHGSKSRVVNSELDPVLLVPGVLNESRIFDTQNFKTPSFVLKLLNNRFVCSVDWFGCVASCICVSVDLWGGYAMILEDCLLSVIALKLQVKCCV